MSELQRLWLELRSPIKNGIMYPSGEFYPIDDDRDPKMQDRIGEPVHGSRLTTHDYSSTSSLSIASTLHIENSRCIAVVGDGSWGSDGFVAVTSLANELMWIAFFDFSNPFLTVAFEREFLFARNSHGETWQFALSHPTSLSVPRVYGS
jgi:hypothetical protein